MQGASLRSQATPLSSRKRNDLAYHYLANILLTLKKKAPPFFQMTGLTGFI